MRIDCIIWLGNFPWHNAYRNKHNVYSNLLDSLRSHLKIQVFWAAYIAHKWPPPGAREMLPPSPKFAKLSTGQIMEHCGPQHLHGFDPITSCSSTQWDFPLSPEGTSSKPFHLPIHAFKVSSECNSKLDFSGILSHSNKDISVLHISFPYISWRQNSNSKCPIFFLLTIHGNTKCLPSQKWKHMTGTMQLIQDPCKITNDFLYL